MGIVRAWGTGKHRKVKAMDEIKIIGEYEVHVSIDDMTYCVVHKGRVYRDWLSHDEAMRLARELDDQKRDESEAELRDELRSWGDDGRQGM